MFWFIMSLLLGAIAVLSLIYNSIKGSKIDALEYEVAYLVEMIFENKSPKRMLTDDEVREIIDAWKRQ